MTVSRFTSIFINFGLIFLLGYFWIFPQYKSFQEVNTQLQNKRIELRDKEEYFSKIEMAKAALEEYKGELSKIDSALPSEPFLSSVLNVLEKTSIENGLVLSQIGFSKVLDSSRALKEIRLEIGVTGSYPAFKNFLSTLENNSRLIEVENISFSTPKEKEPFTFDLDIKTYSY